MLSVLLVLSLLSLLLLVLLLLLVVVVVVLLYYFRDFGVHVITSAVPCDSLIWNTQAAGTSQECFHDLGYQNCVVLEDITITKTVKDDKACNILYCCISKLSYECSTLN